MIFVGFFAVALGGLLLLSSITLVIYVKSIGKEVKTRKPFGWSGILGLLILVRVAVGVMLAETCSPKPSGAAVPT